jgi:hypothetical protein
MRRLRNPYLAHRLGAVMTLNDLATIAWTWAFLELLRYVGQTFKHADLMPAIDGWMVAP